MTKDITITLVNLQVDESGEKHTTTLETNGSYYNKNNKIYLVYDETDPDDGSVTCNTLKLDGATIELTRRGNMESHMRFEAGATSVTRYTTPLGTMHFQIQTEELTITLEDSEGEISLEYSLYQSGLLLYHNHLSIRIKAVAENKI